MRRFLSALALCLCLLFALSFLLYKPARAKEEPIAVLLSLPAPPPPNPLLPNARERDKAFYDKFKQPADDAPIDELLDYWKNRPDDTQLGYTPNPSPRTLARIKAEIEKDHDLLIAYLNVLPDGEESAKFIRDLTESEGRDGVYDADELAAIKSWLTMHTDLYSDELRSLAETIRDDGEYVTANQNELLALTRVDFAKAEPILKRLYSDSSQRHAQVLAKWALYRHALDTGSLDADQYRDELKAVVEDKNATPGMRDLGLDALSKEKGWPGRDEWYLSLLGDETLSDLRVNGQSYTGLTTLMYYIPDDQMTDRMLEMLKSDNKVVRANVIRNLLMKLEGGNIELVRALIPWLEDPKWANDAGNSRYVLVSKLADFEIPESVPGLIRALDEKRDVTVVSLPSNANRAYASNPMSNAAATMANTANMAANVARMANTSYDDNYDRYPLRDVAVTALAKQKDPRAAPALRRMISQVESYQQGTVVRAIIACKGFTIAEQMDGLEIAAKNDQAADEAAPADPSVSYPMVNSNAANVGHRAPTALELKTMIGRELVNSAEVSDELGRAVIARVEQLDKTNRPLADAYRRIATRWKSPVVDLLFLSDLKRGQANAESIVKLLAERKDLREKQSTDVFDIRTGSQTALGISSCLMEDTNDAVQILENGSAEAKTALFACARLIRMPLDVEKVVPSLASEQKLLAVAAERYLESEDSPAARNVILSRHPGEAKILGATSAFFVDNAGETTSEALIALFSSIGNQSLYNGWYGTGDDPELKKIEKQLQDEVKKTDDLLAVYAYDKSYIRIYKDKALFSYDEDDARYRERPLERHEFNDVKAYITDNKLDSLPSFASCGGGYCTAKELVMVSRNGGRRLYVSGDIPTPLDGLAKIFENFKKAPSSLHYAASREIPGLEILLASDDLHVETVWKDGNEVRVAASLKSVRDSIEADVNAIADPEKPGYSADNIYEKQQALREKRLYDGFGWYRVTDQGAEPNAAQPSGVEFLPVRDGTVPGPDDEQWKARATGFEIRAADDGLYKVVRGRATRIKPGMWSDPLVTPNGRWLVARKYSENTEGGLVRVDLVTNREYDVDVPNNVPLAPSSYVPSAGKVLLVTQYSYGEGEDGYQETEDSAPGDPALEDLWLLDPATGDLKPVAGEFRPLNQQTFRPLQPASKPNEFWAAMYDADKNFTEVGIYETRTFGFKPVLKVPKINFNSMSMYVDEAANKVYFVYRGHLLALPLDDKSMRKPARQ